MDKLKYRLPCVPPPPSTFMASSTSGLHDSTPAPPPPTPSSQTISKSFSSDADVALSRFLNQLVLNQTTPSLSVLPPRFSKKPSPSPSSNPPVISLVNTQHDLLIPAASDIGLFHLADHGIPSDIFNRAMQESQSLFNSKPIHSIQSSLGFHQDDEDEGVKGESKFLVFDINSTELDTFPAISEYAKNLERVGLEVVELILSTDGFESPFQKGTIKPKCLMWVSSSGSSSFDATNVSVIKEEEEEGEDMEQAKCYPYVVSLQYEMKVSSVMGEPGVLIAVDPCVDSVLVTLGDIAQVWSNGRFKKMRGTPQHASASSYDCDNLQSISMSLLVTLPMDAMVSPLCSKSDADDGDIDEDAEGGRRLFRPFPFDEYAWRVYHARLPFKDPLLRYKI